MHPDSKLNNHGKQVTSGGQSQVPNVTQQQQQHQGPAGSLGSKGVGAGNHAAKPNQIPPGNSGLKSGGVGGGAKGKAKRERSVSADAPDQRDPALEPDNKDGAMRSKRRCVLEKKQPYSGDEWCSGPDTEEEEDKPAAPPHRELPMVGSVQPLSGPAPIGPVGESGGPALGRGVGPGLHSELPRPHKQVVYVFTTSLANSAAEAVIHGHAESILLFHQQNVPRTKLDQCSSGKLPSLSEQPPSGGTPPTGTPKSQSAPPRPASMGGAIGGGPLLHPAGTAASTGHPENEPPPAAGPGAGASPSRSPPGHLQGEERGEAGAGSGNAGNGSLARLSQEQLEHRERSLQTLRDIERLLLRGGGPNPNANPNIDNPNIDNGCHPNEGVIVRKYEEPLQSMISQTQSLGGGPGMDDPALHGLSHPHPHPHLGSPPPDAGPPLGPDGLTPEQAAWRKLQEEYYQEKRRLQQDVHPQAYRVLPDVGLCVIRGPPPPYRGKPGEPPWAGPAMGGGGNGRLIDARQDVGPPPRAPRFSGQMQRGPHWGGGGGGAGYHGDLPLDAVAHQLRPGPRPGMGWLDDVPAGGGGGPGPFQMGCPPPGQRLHLQGDPGRPLTREEMFRVLEKRQLQSLHRLEMERLAKQGPGGHRMLDGPVGFPGALRGDPVDFPAMRAMMGSPLGGAGPGAGGGDLADFGVNVGPPTSLQQQQQQMMLAQKLRAGLGGAVGGGAGPRGGGVPLSEVLSPEEIAEIRAAQNGRGAGKGAMPHCGVGPLQFPTNQGPFPGPGGGGYLQEEGPDVFGPHPQAGGMSRLGHMALNAGPRAGVELGPRHPSDLSINVNPVGSPSALPLHHSRLKSPPLSQAPSPVLPSPSGPAPPGPTAPSLPPQSSSLKSPQVMGPSSLGLCSPSASPGHVPIASPGWTASPKPTLPSPAGPPNGQGAGNGGGSSVETGQSLPQRSSNSTPISPRQPTSMNPSMPFTSSSDVPANQNPLSLIMSQMSKYAMPSSTPLYHEAIKTIATSDDEMTPDRPLLPGVHMAGNMGNHQSAQQMLIASQSSMGPHSGPQSPMGMVLQGQPQLSHDPSGSMLHSPNTMGIPGMNPAMMSGGGGPPDEMGPCHVSPMLPQNQLGAFSRMQAASQGSLHSPGPGMGQPYPPQPPPDDVLPHGLAKRPRHPSEPFHPSLAPVGDGPDLSEVIRATPTGIPEFDLSRIMPSEKPSSTLQYFPKPHPSSSGSAPPSSNPHLANLQNMMAEQQLGPPLHPSHHAGMRLGLGVAPGGGRGGMGPPMNRTGLSPQQQHHLQQQQHQQAMMANSLLPHPHPHHGMLPSPQHQQALMMLQAKQRGVPLHGDPYGPQGGPLMSPQGPMMGPMHPQSGMMGPQALRHRGMALDSPLGYGPGGMANAPF